LKRDWELTGMLAVDEGYDNDTESKQELDIDLPKSYQIGIELGTIVRTTLVVGIEEDIVPELIE
jgi:hypothetical protein